VPTSTAPQTDLPPYATDGNYAAPGTAWDATARRVATGITGWAAAGATPEGPRLAQSENEWLARAQEWSQFTRDEQGTAIFGDGSDGDVTLGAGTTTLARDMYYDDLTVPNGSTLAAAGFRIFVAGLLTVAAGGVISCDGGNASGVTAGTAGGSGTAPMSNGGTGGTGITDTDNTVGNSATAVTTSIGGAGGTGGSAGIYAGGAGPIAAPAASLGGFRHQSAALGAAPDGTQWRGGGGGGSGASDVVAGTSGGGGGGGGILSIWARRVSNLGTIRANGGNGGNAASAAAGSAGGGAGGGGGAVFLIHREAVGGTLGTVTASGGAGGTGYSNGTTGNNGASGSAGTVITLIG
jgi:hypothetical protein